MNDSNNLPRLTEQGIAFTVTIDRIERNCLISKAALEKLSELKSIDASDADLMELFQAFKLTINGTARSLASSSMPGSPLELAPSIFEKRNASPAGLPPLV